MPPPAAGEGLQPAVEHASSLYGVNIVVKDASGDVIADSRLASSGGSTAPMVERHNLPVLSSGREVGSVALAPSIAPLEVPEPSVSILASALNQSLFWKGIGRRDCRNRLHVPSLPQDARAGQEPWVGGKAIGAGRPLPKGVRQGSRRSVRPGAHLQLNGRGPGKSRGAEAQPDGRRCPRAEDSPI